MKEMIQRLNDDQVFQDKLQAVHSREELQSIFDEYQLDVDADSLYSLLERAKSGELTDAEKSMYCEDFELSEGSLEQVAGGFLPEALGFWVGIWLVKGIVDGYYAEKQRQAKKRG